MTARIDPTKAKYYPEELPEAIGVTAASGGTSVASYSAFSPYVLFLRHLATGHTPSVTLRVDNDSGHAVLESLLTARPNRMPVPMDVVSYDSLDLWMVGSAYATFCAYTLRIAKMTVFEKLKYGVSLSDEEQSLAQELNISKRLSAGVLRSVDTPHYKKVIEVAKTITVTAGSNTRVGRLINVKKGEKAVLLGIAVDSAMTSTKYGGPGVNDTYITINRDKIDDSYVKLDCASMPSIDYEIPCLIPALDRHEIIIESTTGITSLPVRYRYGVADLTVLEKIRWGIPLSKDDRAVADEFDLERAVEAGIL